MRYNLTLWIIPAMLVCADLSAQPTTIVNHFQGDTTGKGLSAFQLSGTSEHRIIVNYYEPAPDKEIDRLNQLVASALNFYIDQSFLVENGKVKLKKTRKDMVSDMNDIVRSAVKYYNYREIASFTGFSDRISDKIDEIAELNLKDNSQFLGVANSEARKREEFFFVQKHLNELKLRANVEVGYFGNANLLVLTGSETTYVDEAARDSLLRELQFDPNATLDPEFNDSGRETLALLGMNDHSVLEPVKQSSPSDEFSSRVLTLLEANNEKLDVMQRQIDELRAEQIKLWQQQQESKNSQMEAQINDLRGMVLDLMRMNSGGAVTSSGSDILLPSSDDTRHSVYNIPEGLNLYFDRGSAQLGANSVFALNEVVDILARNPSIRIIITGYADRSGTAAQNLVLSQKRAAVVKSFMEKSGLGADRFIMRYLGDRDSEAPSADDRRVRLEFIR